MEEQLGIYAKNNELADHRTFGIEFFQLLWEDTWLENHREHTYPDGVDENGEVLEEDGSLHARWGTPPDYDLASGEGGPPHLLICCGTQRPLGKAVSVVVRPAAGPFVTIHDYLSAVHSWLMSSRGDLLAAMGEMMGDQKPWPAETKLMVNYNAPEFLTMQEQADCITEASRPLDPALVAIRPLDPVLVAMAVRQAANQ